MELYEGKPEEERQIGDSKYRMGKSLVNFVGPVFDLRVRGEKKGELEANFKMLGKSYTLKFGDREESFTRPTKWWREVWTLSKGEKPYLIFRETTRSTWVPTVHAFDIIDPNSGKKVGYLSAKWNTRRFLVNRRDYAVEFFDKTKQHLSLEELEGVLTVLGPVYESQSSSSSGKSSSGK